MGCAAIPYFFQLTTNTKNWPMTPKTDGSCEETILRARYLRPAENVIMTYFLKSCQNFVSKIVIEKYFY